MDLAVIPECYVDTNMIETIAPPNGKGYNHQKGCGTVTKVMKENFADSFALGIIDKDKKQVDYLNDFTEVINAGSLLLHKHKTKHHYIIQINPVVETFIIANAASVGISLSDFNLPVNADLFKKESKQEQSKKDVRFRGLFKAIKNAGAADFVRLSQWVVYLRDARYNADINELH